MNLLRQSTSYAIESDHLGTPVRVVDPAGTVVWSWEDHDPFGNSPPMEGVSNGQTFTFDLRMPGQYFDEETGLFHNGARDYDPQTGRYIEVDPLGLAAGMNPYVYVDGDPVNQVNPTGLSVMVYGRPTRFEGADSFVNYTGIEHQWIKTGTYEAGMGPATGVVPGGAAGPDGYASPVGTVDHSGQSIESGSHLIRQYEDDEVDEGCVNNMIKPGRDIGSFLPPFYDCHTFVNQVIEHCSVHKKSISLMPRL